MGQQKDTQGDGGGPLIGNPAAPSGGGASENAKSRDWKDPGGGAIGGTTAQEEADKKGRTGQGMTGKPR